MNSGASDVLEPYLDFFPEINRVDFRKYIFIFLSTTGSDNITRVTQALYKNVKICEKITRRQMETLLKEGEVNNDFIFIDAIFHHLVTLISRFFFSIRGKAC